jgi:phage/plasmid-associated DNA primase
MGTTHTSPGKPNYRGLDLEKTSPLRSRQKFFLDIPFYRTRGVWLVWSGRLWVKDETGATNRAAVETARQRLLASMQIEDPEKRKAAVSWAFRSEGSYGRKAMLASAETIEELATTTADYNRDPYALVVGNGNLDLRTAKLRE